MRGAPNAPSGLARYHPGGGGLRWMASELMLQAHRSSPTTSSRTSCHGHSSCLPHSASVAVLKTWRVERSRGRTNDLPVPANGRRRGGFVGWLVNGSCSDMRASVCARGPRRFLPASDRSPHPICWPTHSQGPRTSGPHPAPLQAHSCGRDVRGPLRHANGRRPQPAGSDPCRDRGPLVRIRPRCKLTPADETSAVLSYCAT